MSIAAQRYDGLKSRAEAMRKLRPILVKIAQDLINERPGFLKRYDEYLEKITFKEETELKDQTAIEAAIEKAPYALATKVERKPTTYRYNRAYICDIREFYITKTGVAAVINIDEGYIISIQFSAELPIEEVYRADEKCERLHTQTAKVAKISVSLAENMSVFHHTFRVELTSNVVPPRLLIQVKISYACLSPGMLANIANVKWQKKTSKPTNMRIPTQHIRECILPYDDSPDDNLDNTFIWELRTMHEQLMDRDIQADYLVGLATKFIA